MGIDVKEIARYGEVIVDGQRYINRVPISVVPKMPKRTDIFGYSKPKEKQKWVRQELPKEVDNWTREEREAYYEREWERRRNGFWFYNDGEPTYITGAHYFYVNWCQIDIGYPDYRDRDRRFFYFWEECSRDPNSYGMIFMKHRREGASWKSAALQLYYITSEMNAHGGMLSKTGHDAKKLFEKVVHVWRRLPSFFLPISDGTDNPKTAINFQRPAKRRTTNNKDIDNGLALDSSISWMNTTENSYDGQKLRFFNQDESGKWTDVSSERNWYIVKPAMSTGRKIYGKSLFTSTVNEMESGGESFKSLWNDSDYHQRDENQQTLSGLYRYFSPAYDGYEGFIDEFGRSVVETPKEPVMGIDGILITKGSKEFLETRRKTLSKDTNKLAEEKRMHPFDEEEALRAPAKDCQFDAEKIYQQIEWLDVYEDTYVTIGNFVWRNGVKGGAVDFMPTKSGRWSVTWMPDGDDQSRRDSTGHPINRGNIVMGCDPYDHRHVSDGRASKAAAYVFRMALPNEPESNMFVCEYHYRQPSPEMFYEDMLLTTVFYGCQVLVETQKIGLLNWFEREGYGKYIMDRPESTHSSWSKTHQKSKGVPSSPAIIDAITGATEHYVLTNVGIMEDGGVGNLYFRDLLEDWLKFDPNNTKDFDCSMAAGYTLLATKKVVRTKKEVKRQPIVRRFDNTGVLSKAIGNV
jgi:hypothetical protein